MLTSRYKVASSDKVDTSSVDMKLGLFPGDISLLDVMSQMDSSLSQRLWRKNTVQEPTKY